MAKQKSQDLLYARMHTFKLIFLKLLVGETENAWFSGVISNFKDGEYQVQRYLTLSPR